MSSEHTAERERELDRLLTFIDAAVAIAITLLVLPLVDLTREVGAGDSVADLLQDHLAELWSFLLSFVVIAQMWRAQQHSLQHVVVAHPAVTRLLLIWTLTIVFLPFPTALLPAAGDQPVTKIVYIGTILLSTLLLGALTWVVIANPQIADGLGVPSLRPVATTSALLLLALVVSLAFPATGYYPLLLLFLEPQIHRLLDRLRAVRDS